MKVMFNPVEQKISLSATVRSKVFEITLTPETARQLRADLLTAIKKLST